MGARRNLRMAASLFVTILAMASSAADAASPVRVLTSFPPSFFEPFQQEFSKRHPDLTVEIIQRKSTAASSNIAGGRPVGADVFWASAPDAFERLKASGGLAATAARQTGAPERIAGYPVNDPDLNYLGFAMSGYGLAYNRPYLESRGLPVPATWVDLTRAVYAGHVGVTSPSRSGTTHFVVEALLQSLGWERGWAVWSGIGGNLATVTARSFGVSAGVARGRFGIGVSIDFLGRPQGRPDDPIDFVLPRELILAPASIAILADAPNREGAERFVDFVLSPEGQALLMRPDVGRFPVSPSAYPMGGEMLALGDAAGPSGRRFDAGLSARRYEAVNVVFDEMITQRRAELARLWRGVHTLEGLLARTPDPEAARLVRLARAALERPPIREEDAVDPALASTIARVPRGLPVSDLQARFESRVRKSVDEKHKAASVALDAARERLAPSRESRPAVTGGRS